MTMPFPGTAARSNEAAARHPNSLLVAGRRRAATSLGGLGDPAADIHVSSISIAEIAIKTVLSKLAVHGDLPAAIEQSGFHSLPFTLAHTVRLADLPWHDRDPFDRVLIVQAMSEDLVFASVDQACRDYAVRVLA